MVTTITTTTDDDVRILKAFGAKLLLARDATEAEVKADMISYMQGVVMNQEKIVAGAAAAAEILPLEPT